MFNTSKIVKKGDAKVTELEEEIAKTLQHYEQSNPDIQSHLKLIYINSAEQVEFKQADGSVSKYILVRIPFRSLASYRKVGSKVIDHLEAKFKWTVVIAANRTIISTRAISHPSQKRPRSRTLKAVHSAILDDIVCPSGVTGRQIKVTIEGKRSEKIFLDPLDKDNIESRLEAISHAYQKLTTHHVTFDFSKPTAFQAKKLNSLKQKK